MNCKTDYHPYPRLATEWHTHGTDFKNSVKALKMEEILNSQPFIWLSELVGWTQQGWESDKTKISVRI